MPVAARTLKVLPPLSLSLGRRFRHFAALPPPPRPSLTFQITVTWGRWTSYRTQCVFMITPEQAGSADLNWAGLLKSLFAKFVHSQCSGVLVSQAHPSATRCPTGSDYPGWTLGIRMSDKSCRRASLEKCLNDHLLLWRWCVGSIQRHLQSITKQ